MRRWVKWALAGSGLGFFLGLITIIGLRQSDIKPWPVACSLRGCISWSDWDGQIELEESFTKYGETENRSAADALTTLIRQHLVSESPGIHLVTDEDVMRYRQSLLHIDEEVLKNELNLTVNEYDKLVVRPFLEQETVGELRKVESRSELFVLLASERPIWVMAWGYQWDSTKAQVVN
jgi:hypothetical protein